MTFSSPDHVQCGCAQRAVCAWPTLFSIVGVLIVGALPAFADQPFTDEAVGRGINYWIPDSNPIPPPYGHGLAFADLDSDGDPDLVVTGAAGGQVGVFENTGGQFTNRSGTSGIPLLTAASGVVAFDYDGDGDLDLLISQWNYPTAMLRNNGAFSFTDVATPAHIAAIGKGTGPTIGDFDGDDRLDVFLSFYGEENRLYRNMGDQSFQEVSASAGISGAFNTLQSAFFDMDMDGDKDLYISNDQRSPVNVNEYNRLFENVDGNFVEISAISGTNIGLNSMNIGLADLDNNGFLDIYCTNWSIPDYGFFYPSYLLMNSGDGTFVEQQQAAGVESFRFGWGAVFLDFDNDKKLDLYVCNQEGANRLYVNKGQWPLVDEAALFDVGLLGDTRCVATADVDADGDLDMVVQEFGNFVRLLINNDGDSRHWLRIAPIGPLPNRQSIGAIVRVRTGDLWQMQELVAGSNYKAQNELIAHFGMDGESHADDIVVQWSDGATRTLSSIPSNQLHKVYHPALLGDLNEDGSIHATETLAFINALTNPAFPDPTRFDFSGNGEVDGADIQGMVNRILHAP